MNRDKLITQRANQIIPNTFIHNKKNHIVFLVNNINERTDPPPGI